MTLPPSTNINAFPSRILVYSVRYEVEQQANHEEILRQTSACLYLPYLNGCFKKDS